MVSKTSHTIIIGDARKMSYIPDESIHLIVVSIPYGDIKDYGHEKQIGFGQTYNEYIDSLNQVWNECYRVLHKGRRMCVNVGDQYLSAKKYERYRVLSIKTDIEYYCRKIGFDFMGNILWRKITTTNPSGGASIMGSWLSPTDPIIKFDFEYILLFKKYLKKGEKRPFVSKEQKEESKIPEDLYREYTKAIWNIKGVQQKEGHPAEFPEEIPKRLITLYSFVRENVLDCCLGSGTTTLASLKGNRNSFGYEINEEYLELIKKKVGINKLTEIIDNNKFKIIIT